MNIDAFIALKHGDIQNSNSYTHALQQVEKIMIVGAYFLVYPLKQNSLRLAYYLIGVKSCQVVKINQRQARTLTIL